MAADQTILVIDDEVHVRHVMELKLRSAGFNVETASDGEEGLRAAAEIKPSLILSDFQMPRMNGLEMCRALAAQEMTRSIPIILVTSRDFEITAEQTAATGIRVVKNKPFSPREILALVQKILATESAVIAAA